MKLSCPKCNKIINFTITDSISDDGEVFMCPHCGWKFRYVEK